MRYVALGDSYTIGTSVSEEERWPNQLVARLAELDLELAGNLGGNGHASSDVLADGLPRLARLRPELASLQVGVNDVVRGVPDERFGANVSEILDALLEMLPPNRVFAVATPDYTVTPQGSAYGVPELQRAGVLHVNEILRGACEQRGIAFVPDIFEISSAAGDDPSMLASDGLHPSGAQYALWVDVIEPLVRTLLAGDATIGDP